MSIEAILTAHEASMTALHKRACEESEELSKKMLKVVGDPLATVKDLGLHEEKEEPKTEDVSDG